MAEMLQGQLQQLEVLRHVIGRKNVQLPQLRQHGTLLRGQTLAGTQRQLDAEAAALPFGTLDPQAPSHQLDQLP